MVLNDEEMIKFETKMREINPEIGEYLTPINNSQEVNNLMSKKHTNVSDLMRELTIPIGFYVKHTIIKDEDDCENMKYNGEYKDNDLIDKDLFEKLFALAEFKNDADETNSKLILKQKSKTKKNKYINKMHRDTKKNK
jgi:hypothetical protein